MMSPPLQTQEFSSTQVPVEDDYINMDPAFQLENNPAYNIKKIESDQTSTTEYDYINPSEYIYK